MRRRQPAPAFAYAPAWSPDGDYDVVVVGIPDHATGLSGARSDRGPRVIREAASAISPQEVPGRHPGWYDYTRQAMVGAGLRWADAGDLVPDPVQVGESRRLVPDLLDRIQQNCALLVVLLGDDALSYYAHVRHRGSLLHIDAHEDALAARGEAPNHANFISYLDRVDDLRIGQFGLRGLSGRRPEPPPTRVFLPDLEGLKKWLAERPGEPLAVALDVDVIDPSILRSVGSPVPDGLAPPALLAVFTAVAEARSPVRRISLAEFAPDPGSLGARAEAMLLAHLIIRVAGTLTS